MTHLLGALLILLVPLASLAQTPSPPPDWIDEFPSVTEVAHAAYEELKVTAQRSGIDPTDEDGIAINLAGTFVVLRQIMLLKYNEERGMKKDREEKLKKLVASYLEAELTIGRGWAGRRGYITRAAPTGMGCRDEPCYRRWFLLHLNASSGRAEYRQRVLNRLFPCGTLAKELNDLRQKHATTVPYMPSPAATLSIDREFAGIGPAGCAAYGGDPRQNGLCDGWKLPPSAPTAGPITPAPGVAAAKKAPGVAVAKAPLAPASAGAPASGAFRTSGIACQPPIVLTKVMMAKGGGLLVSIAPTSAKEGDVVTFSVSRSKTEKPDGSPGATFWEQPAKIVKGSTGLQAVVAMGEPLAPNTTRPFLFVDTTSTRSTGPVHCEQPTKNWEKRHLLHGLHGPYTSVDEAALNDQASSIAQRATGRTRAEHGFVIVRSKSKPEYFVAPPLASSTGPAGGTAQPLFATTDYRVSFERAFEKSCENAEDYTVAALVHVHPNTWGVPNMFTAQDYHQAIQIDRFKSGCPPNVDSITQWFCANARGFELTVMIDDGDGKTRTFRPCPKDPLFDKDEMEAGHSALEVWFVEKWREYRKRTDEISKNVTSRACAPRGTR